jgi:hypothetical protein
MEDSTKTKTNFNEIGNDVVTKKHSPQRNRTKRNEAKAWRSEKSRATAYTEKKRLALDE